MPPDESDEPNRNAQASPGPDWQDMLRALAEGARFLTRLPLSLPFLAPASGDVARMAWTFPVIGALIGLIEGILYAAGIGLHLGPLTGAILSVAGGVALTGALHEDGLADTFDGFGGGTSRANKLEIMRDSRLGTYGALGLLFAMLLRIAALTALAPLGPLRVMLVLIAGEAVARAAMVRLWHELPAARSEGLSASGAPDHPTMVLAIAIGLGLAILTVLPAAGLYAALWGVAAAAAASLAFTRLCRHQIGGQTGDTLGAVEQLALTAFLLLTAAFS